MRAAVFSGGRIGKIQVVGGGSPAILFSEAIKKEFWGYRRLAEGERSEGLENSGRRGLLKQSDEVYESQNRSGAMGKGAWICV